MPALSATCSISLGTVPASNFAVNNALWDIASVNFAHWSNVSVFTAIVICTATLANLAPWL